MRILIKILFVLFSTKFSIEEKSVSSDDNNGEISYNEKSEYDHSIVKYEDHIEFRKEFLDFTENFKQDQSNVIEKSENLLESLKLERKTDLRILKYPIKKLKLEIANQDKNVNSRKQDIPNTIDKINNLTSDQFESLKEEERMLENELKYNKTKLSKKKHGLQQIIDSSSKDFIEEFYLEQQVITINQKLASLDTEFIEKSQRINNKLRDLKASSASALNENYRKLIEIYEIEEKEIENLKILKNEEIACTPVDLGGDVLMINNCAGINLDDEIEIDFNDDTYKCKRTEEVDEDNFFYTFCRMIGEFKESPCKTFIMNPINNRINAFTCSEYNFKSSLNYDRIIYECKTFAMISECEYQYDECSKVKTAVDGYVVDKLKTRFFIPRVKNDNDDEIPCKTFKTRDSNDLFTENCQEKFSVMPKLIEFGDKIYLCHGFEYLDQSFIYEYCDEEITTLTTTTNQPSTSVLISKLKIFKDEKNENSCKYYIIEIYGNYDPFDCQIKNNSFFYIYDGFDKIKCSELNIESFTYSFGGCKIDNSLTMPTTEDINLDYYHVTYDTLFYVPITDDENDYVTSCTVFSYKLGFSNKLFASNCQEKDYNKTTVTFNEKIIVAQLMGNLKFMIDR